MSNIKKFFILIIFLFILQIPIYSCQKKAPEVKIHENLLKTRLKITVESNCYNLILNNSVEFVVKKVGGGYNSGKFTVPVGDDNGITIDLPSGGTYTVKGYGEGKDILNFNAKNWETTLSIKDNTLFRYGPYCN
tara:strand:- start:135 stop:536 length:402 start_codon:yes stop_codon:yes gene_type:complete